MKNKVIEIFLDKTHFNKDSIINVTSIEGGSSSNDNYLVELKDGKKYQVKIPDARMNNLKSYYAYTKYETSLVKFINEDGLLIKEWIEGNTPDFNNKDDSLKVLQELQSFHTIKPSKSYQRSFGLYIYRETTNISNDLLNEFDQLSKLLETFPKGFMHGDINPGNILITNKKAYLIDLEWAMKGWPILDYAYLIAFSNIDPKIVADFSGFKLCILEKLVRLVFIHTLMWCENEKTKKGAILFKKIMKKLS